MLTVAESRREVIDKMVQALDFVQSQAGPPPINSVPEDCRSDNIECIDVFSRVRLIKKAMEKQRQKDKQKPKKKVTK